MTSLGARASAILSILLLHLGFLHVLVQVSHQEIRRLPLRGHRAWEMALPPKAPPARAIVLFDRGDASEAPWRFLGSSLKGPGIRKFHFRLWAWCSGEAFEG